MGRLLIKLIRLAADKEKVRGRRQTREEEEKEEKKERDGSPSSGSSARALLELRRHFLFIPPPETANEPGSAAHLDPRYSTVNPGPRPTNHEPPPRTWPVCKCGAIASIPLVDNLGLNPRCPGQPHHLLLLSQLLLAVRPAPPRDSVRQSPDLTCATGYIAAASPHVCLSPASQIR